MPPLTPEEIESARQKWAASNPGGVERALGMTPSIFGMPPPSNPFNPPTAQVDFAASVPANIPGGYVPHYGLAAWEGPDTTAPTQTAQTPTYDATTKALAQSATPAVQAGPYKPGEVVSPATRDLVGVSTTSTSAIPKPKDYDANQLQISRNFEEGQKLLAKAAGEEQKATEQRVQMETDAQNEAMTKYAAVEAQRAAIETDFNAKMQPINEKIHSGAVDPNHLWKEKGAFAQFAAAISMGLGSFGASLTGGPNFAMQIIDNAINRDIRAQEVNLDKAFREKDAVRSDLADAIKLLGSKEAGIAAIKSQKWAQAALMAERMGAGIKSDQVQGNLLKSTAQFQQEQEKYRLDALEKFTPKSQSTSSSVIRPERRADQTGNLPGSAPTEKEDEARVNLGNGQWGLARSKEEAAKIDEALLAGRGLMRDIDTIEQLRTKGPAIWGTPDAALLEAAVNRSLQGINTMLGSGVLNTGGEVDRAKSIFGNAHELLSPNALKVLQNTRNYVSSRMVDTIKTKIRAWPEGVQKPREVSFQSDLKAQERPLQK